MRSYSSGGKPFAVDLGRISGSRIRATWHDPRTGEPIPAGEFDQATTQAFAPPVGEPGEDWVLILDGSNG